MGMPVTTPDGEIDGEDFHPEARRLVVAWITGSKRGRLQDDDQKRQAHGELGKQIVERDREGELQAVDSPGQNP
jgi:hypothetical protein